MTGEHHDFVGLSRLEEFDIVTRDPDETSRLGEFVGKNVTAPAVVALVGDLGAGKTEFVKGFVRGIGSDDEVSSPTFAILNTYLGATSTVHHFDLYRIEDEGELHELGFDEYLFGEDICLIEWAERAGALLPPETMRIRFEHVSGSERRIHIER